MEKILIIMEMVPANTNKAISMCSGDIIKVMFQDDFFYDDEALEKIW